MLLHTEGNQAPKRYPEIDPLHQPDNHRLNPNSHPNQKHPLPIIQKQAIFLTDR